MTLLCYPTHILSQLLGHISVRTLEVFICGLSPFHSPPRPPVQRQARGGGAQPLLSPPLLITTQLLGRETQQGSPCRVLLASSDPVTRGRGFLAIGDSPRAAELTCSQPLTCFFLSETLVCGSYGEGDRGSPCHAALQSCTPHCCGVSSTLPRHLPPTVCSCLLVHFVPWTVRSLGCLPPNTYVCLSLHRQQDVRTSQFCAFSLSLWLLVLC